MIQWKNHWNRCIAFRRHTLDSFDLARFIVDVVEDKKAEDIVLLDLRPDAIIADFFVICNATNIRQLKTMAENVRVEVKEQFGKVPFSSEGTPESGWILLDYADVVVHVFMEEQREYYGLETLWAHEGNVLLSIQ